jgi:hypothetical protein
VNEGVSRRSFFRGLGGAMLWSEAASAGGAALANPYPVARPAIQNQVVEWSYSSGKAYANPFHDVDLDVIFTRPDGGQDRVPAFWAGEQTWRVRYAAAQPGRYEYRSVCSDSANADLHGRTGALEATLYFGSNLLFRHGGLRVSADHRHFQHSDGTPFFFLGDDWWYGMCKRLRWPEDFQLLAADRKQKGFSVIQMASGFACDTPERDARGENEAGLPWIGAYERINPAYFDAADLRLQYLVEQEFMVTILGTWGYYLLWMGVEKMKKHWRYLIARWGAYPVIWCLAGEGDMGYYLSKTREQDRAALRKGWSEVGRYVRDIDPYHRLITTHPWAPESSRMALDDPSVLDFEIQQSGHRDIKSAEDTIRILTASLEQQPPRPAMVGEACFEGLVQMNRQEMQRFLFWACILSGAAGHCYGADGVWSFDTEEEPFGKSPSGIAWSDVPWKVAYQYPGSGQIGMSKKYLVRFPWWRLEPHPEWIDSHGSRDNYDRPYAGGIPRELRLIYLPQTWAFGHRKVQNLEPGIRYQASYFRPITGKEYPVGIVEPDAVGAWTIPPPPVLGDWVLALTKA